MVIIIVEELLTGRFILQNIQGYEEQPKIILTYKVVANTSRFKYVLSNLYYKSYYLSERVQSFNHKLRNNSHKSTMFICIQL